MTEQQLLLWIYKNLGDTIQKALTEHRKKAPSLIYTEDDLIGITMREVGGLIKHYISLNIQPAKMWPLMRGDYSQRRHDKEKCYHGYGVTQIDIDSFPDFVKSGDWKDPYKCYYKSILVLEGKRRYITVKVPSLKGEELKQAVIAAYNCGEGNVVKAIKDKLSFDHYTTGRDYSSEVLRFKSIVNAIPEFNNIA